MCDKKEGMYVIFSAYFDKKILALIVILILVYCDYNIYYLYRLLWYKLPYIQLFSVICMLLLQPDIR
jgi:hypothetical protein